MTDRMETRPAGQASHLHHPCGGPVRIAAEQPGTFVQQLQIIDVYLDDPTRRRDPSGAWAMARRLILPHARRCI